MNTEYTSLWAKELWMEAGLNEFRPAIFSWNLGSNIQQTHKATGTVGQRDGRVGHHSSADKGPLIRRLSHSTGLNSLAKIQETGCLCKSGKDTMDQQVQGRCPNLLLCRFHSSTRPPLQPLVIWYKSLVSSTIFLLFLGILRKFLLFFHVFSNSLD